MVERYSLADVDGVLCVRFETSDYNVPQLVAHYWPTNIRTRDLLYFYDQKSLDEFKCVKSRPGEYFVGLREIGPFARWKEGQHVQLKEGVKTKSIKHDLIEVRTPKVKKGTRIYWSGGYWVKHTSRGVEKIEPVPNTP